MNHLTLEARIITELPCSPHTCHSAEDSRVVPGLVQVPSEEVEDPQHRAFTFALPEILKSAVRPEVVGRVAAGDCASTSGAKVLRHLPA